MLGNRVGGCRDVSIETLGGWRVKSRNVLSAQEAAAKITLQDYPRCPLK
jgi:hypothetical protein